MNWTSPDSGSLTISKEGHSALASRRQLIFCTGQQPVRQSGFTLIEVAMVLMIVGLLFGSIVKGQELVNRAKTRSLAQDFLTIQTALYSYQYRFRAVPGDERYVAVRDSRASLATTPNGMVGNGRIDGDWDSTTNTDESRLFWQHVRVAGFLAGPIEPADPDYAPQSQFLTRIGISSTMQITGPTPMIGLHNICTSGIPGKFVKQLDTQIDDGNTLTGSLRAASEDAPHMAVAASAIDDGGKYVVCLAF